MILPCNTSTSAANTPQMVGTTVVGLAEVAEVLMGIAVVDAGVVDAGVLDVLAGVAVLDAGVLDVLAGLGAVAAGFVSVVDAELADGCRG